MTSRHPGRARGTESVFRDIIAAQQRLLVTPDEARKAIYMDFEGGQNQPPAVPGLRWTQGMADAAAQYALSQDLATAVENRAPLLHRWPKRYMRMESDLPRMGVPSALGLRTFDLPPVIRPA